MKGKAPADDSRGDIGFPYANAPWVQATNRFMGAELRPDPRPKPGRLPRLKHWKQADLAVASDIRANTLSDVLAGKRKPSLETLESIAKALGQPVFLFLMDADEAERYARYRAAHQQQLEATNIQASAERAAHKVLADLAPTIATMIQRELLQAEAKPEPPAIVHPKRKRA